jgi:hypothetical protein
MHCFPVLVVLKGLSVKFPKISVSCSSSCAQSLIISDELDNVSLKSPPRINFSPFLWPFRSHLMRLFVNALRGLIFVFVSDCCSESC